jgi:hypothetical protein
MASQKCMMYNLSKVTLASLITEIMKISMWAKSDPASEGLNLSTNFQALQGTKITSVICTGMA